MRWSGSPGALRRTIIGYDGFCVPRTCLPAKVARPPLCVSSSRSCARQYNGPFGSRKQEKNQTMGGTKKLGASWHRILSILLSFEISDIHVPNIDEAV
ncbi:unnamed protein product, partial [Nesidiocoris tenuis]